MKKLIFLIAVLLVAAIGIFLWLSGTGEYRSSKENEERMRIRKDELGKANPELLVQLENNVETLEQKTKETPDESTYWFELGTNKYQLGDYAGAEKALKKAAQLDAISINALHNLGILYQDRGEYQKAEEAFKEIVRRHPNLADGYIRLAELYRPGTYKDKREEERILLTGLKVMEKDTILLLTLAEYYDRAKLSSQALATYKKLLALNPPNLLTIEEEIARLEKLQ